jgi:hypothetical protein
MTDLLILAPSALRLATAVASRSARTDTWWIAATLLRARRINFAIVDFANSNAGSTARLALLKGCDRLLGTAVDMDIQNK